MTLRHLTKVVSLVLAMSVMTSFSLWALVQEIDYTPEQYEAYNKCANLADPEAKQQCILDFIEEHPKLSLVEYVIAEYGRALQEQIQKGQHEQMVTAGEAMLKYRPDEIKLITQLCYSAYNCGQYAKAAKYGELAYASNPAAGFIQILTDAYKKTGNEQKYREWALVAIEKLEPSQSFQFVEEFRTDAARAENWSRAASHSKMTLDFLSKMERTSNASEAEWNSWVRKQRAISLPAAGPGCLRGWGLDQGCSQLSESHPELSKQKSQRRSPLLHRDVELEGKPSPAGHGSLCLRGGSEGFSPRRRVRRLLDPSLQVHPQ